MLYAHNIQRVLPITGASPLVGCCDNAFDRLGSLEIACIYGHKLVKLRTAGEPKKLAFRLRLLLSSTSVGKAGEYSDTPQSRVRVSG
jgi:hypothetical protein